MKRTFILAIDQGTTGSRAFLFDDKGHIAASSYREFKQYYPKPGWVEHDTDEIWRSCVTVIKEAVSKAKIKQNQIAAIGITNQRETTVLWDRKTSKPVHRAIVWQCRRTASLCDEYKKKGLETTVRAKTGLVLDPYFSGTKIKWLLDHVEGLREEAERGQICFGTIDSWLIWKLTGGKSHATDNSNASRTLLFNIETFRWDEELLKIFDIPHIILPRVLNSGANFGRTEGLKNFLSAGIPITAVMGDQQAALFGQGCYEAGSIKNTYGTGCFLVLNTGKKKIASEEGLLSTVASDIEGKPIYALEGSIFIAGAVIQWLRDELKIIKNAADTETLIKGLNDTNGVYFVPAFAGLGAPYWDSGARGLISGLTRGANAKHIIRAALESICYQTKDVFDIMQKAYGSKIERLKVDGGACRNNFLMQFQSDVLNCSIVRPEVIETTAQGAAYLSGLMAGLWQKEDLLKLQKVGRTFTSRMTEQQRQGLYDGWLKAVKKVRP
ncbi:MAG: glycerol kinase [Omnitrophica WOR_2 bacterium GWA2_47_8]|nr:MAG: glycerol kinase [Omnitrophica WOR_2 bacterium GWA2_47_8]